MMGTSRLTEQAKLYLTQFYTILDEMECGMTTAELSESISHNFIVQMIPHHRAAIEMSENLLKYPTCAPLYRIASGIITAQEQSIEAMQAILPKCSERCNSEQELALYQRRTERILCTMFDAMGGAPETNCIDTNFMREMIPHHEGAVRMSENALKYDICPELRPILCTIIKLQRRGIREMQALLRA